MTAPRPRRQQAVPGPEVPVYVISVAAELTGLHPQTLRTYDRLGLVVPGRTGGGGRRYSLHDIEVLREIADLSAAGIGLEGVRRILELEREVGVLRRRNAELAGRLDGALEAWADLQRQVARAQRAAEQPRSNLPVVAPPAPGSAVVVWRRQRGL